MKIYVVTTKKESLKLPNSYEYIQVNAENSREDFYDLKDNIGENISIKNPNYCELTATYWIWKNDKENDVVGLMHYRRFLTKNKFSSKTKFFLNEKDVSKFLKKYDFIATKKYKTNISVKEHLLISVREKDFNILNDVMKNKFSDYYDAFEKVFIGNESYLLNIFIAKKVIFDRYAEWLFKVLSEVEKHVSYEGYSIQEKRLLGYLAERLFYVYVLKNDLKVKSFPTCIIGASKIELIKGKILKILHIKKY